MPPLKEAWQLTWPYFWSEEKWSAWALLAGLVALNLAQVGMTVILNFWNRAFFNALQDKDWHTFIELLLLYHRGKTGLMPGFVLLAAVYIVMAAYNTYVNQWLQIRWRRWMTGRLLDDWLRDRAYYRISLTTDHAAVGTDNPDQRVSDDVREFVNYTLSLGVSLLSNVVTVFSFLGILWSLSGAFAIFGISIPGYMVWVALIYALFGTVLTHLIGRPLIWLNFRKQRVEADFRYALVRLRENMEGIALYGGEPEEKANLAGRFSHVVQNWYQVMLRTKLINALTAGYGQVAGIFPIVVAAPRYFSGGLPLGGLTQTADAFGQVQGSMAWFVSAYQEIATWRAIVQRLSTFQRAIQIARAAAAQGIVMTDAPADAVTLQDVTITLPDGTPLLRDFDLTLKRGQSVVVTGRSGSGKSTLFRAIAGIWRFGSGEVRRPAEDVLFLPQQPYIPLGTLRHAVTYPGDPASFDQATVAQALADVDLERLTPQLDDDRNWPLLLSGGEQQRLAVARALLARPAWLFLDEATASLDPEAEAELYAVLKSRLVGTTIVSIAHRPTVAALHDRRLVFQPRTASGPGRVVETEPAA